MTPILPKNYVALGVDAGVDACLTTSHVERASRPAWMGLVLVQRTTPEAHEQT